MQKVLYRNKCVINCEKVIDPNQYVGRHIIHMRGMDNYITVGYVAKSGDFYVVLNYTNYELDSLDYLYKNGFENIDPNHEYMSVEHFARSVRAKQIKYDSLQLLEVGDHVVDMNDIDILFNNVDEPFEPNELNFIDFDRKCDYYTTSRILAMSPNDLTNFKVLSLMWTNQDEWMVMDISTFKDEQISFFNFLYNIKFVTAEGEVIHAS